MTLTSRQQQIIIGSVLGDGGIYKRTDNSNAHYYVKQSKENYEYVRWLFKELEEFCPSRPKQRKDNGSGISIPVLMRN